MSVVRRARRILKLLAAPLAFVACGGGSDASGPSSAATQFLIQHNARFNDGFTVRWADLPIPVFTSNIAQQGEVTEWTRVTGGRVTFTFVGSRPASGISFRFEGGTDICGVTTVEFGTDGRITFADVRVVREVFRGPQCVRTVTHEVGHAIGFLDHTSDGGLMDDDGGNGEITAPVVQMFHDLYSMAPGTFVGLGERARTAPRHGRRSMTFIYPTRK